MKWMFGGLTLLVVAIACTYVAFQPSSAGGVSTTPPATENRDMRTGKWQFIVLLDVSASRPSAMIRQGQQYVDTIIDGMSYGDRLLLLQMYEETVREAKEPLVLQLKQGASSLSLNDDDDLKRDREGLKDTAQLYFGRADANRVSHTDILTTLSVVSEHIAHDRRNAIVILSDMLQSDKEFEFEHLQRMPPPNWIAQRKEQGLIRPLGGSCVLAIGADPSSREGVIVRKFWQEYFETSNALLKPENYRTTTPTPSDAAVCE